MDYYSFDSEVIESLNLLRPPVKRDRKDTNKDLSVYNSAINDIKALREFGQKFTTKRTKLCTHTKREDSSTSLVLKKTSERQIFKQYSVVSYTNLNCQEQAPSRKTKQHADKDKPLIKVTVIPNSEANPGAKLLRKQRVVAKTIQSTSSNHENSIQTKNVYLVVAGRKKDKVYEIKTTGSAKFERKSIKDDAIENLSNFKQFIKTLTMERKGKKDKRKDVKERNAALFNVCENVLPNVEHVCNCSMAQDDLRQDVRTGKSRVRVFGKIGLTKDEKYVLKCQATVNDKPVPTSLSTAEKQLSSSSLAAYDNDNTATSQRRHQGIACVSGVIPDTDIKNLKDSIMQTDHRNHAVNELPMDINNKNKIRKESQSTQVNLNIPNDSVYKTSAFRADQVTGCNCGHEDYQVINTVKTECDGKKLKSCQSPLVIISVFPKQENNLSELVKTVQCAQIENRRAAFPEYNQIQNTSNKTEMTKTKNTKLKTVRSRSPSPRGPKSKENKIIDTRLVKNIPRYESPLRLKLPKREQSPKHGTNSTKHTLQFFNSNTNKDVTDKIRKPSPSRSPRAKSPVITPKREPPKSITASGQSFKPKPKRKVDKGMNTEHLKTKKALIDSYTKRISQQMSPYKEKHPIKDASRVSVNIDSGNEYYDLSFRQDRFTTDLNVRKTMKEASVQKCASENQNRGSMEKYLPYIRKKHRKSSFCQSICENQTNDVNLKVTDRPRLSVRDSLEISHRREDKAFKITQTRRPSEQLSTINNEMDFLAPIKHFTGDNCTICDPIERDREIRELLGVDGRKAKSKSNIPQSQIFAVGDQLSRHCFHPNQCKNSLIAGLALNTGMTLCPFISETAKCQDEDFYNKSEEKVQFQNNDTTENSNDSNEYFEQTREDEIKTDAVQKNDRQLVCSSTQYEGLTEGTSLYQQLTLNRNVQVFLQVDQFSKQKPIMLSRKQYNKVKRTIQNTISVKDKTRRCVCNRSIVSVGQFREKQSTLAYSNREAQTDAPRKESVVSLKIKKRLSKPNVREPVDTVVLFSNDARGSVKEKNPQKGPVRQAVSSMEIRYASVAYLKHVTFSSTNVGSIGSSSFAHRNQQSIETLFRGHRKSLTPNLGTSALSLCSEVNISESQSMKVCLPGAKAKKPFLKRLISCLVMRSARASEGKIEPKPVSQPLSVNSSVDSYHISTSFAAIEMTSSIYDTSASFYSDHSIHPLSSKLKRSFFSSVKGLLPHRKS